MLSSPRYKNKGIFLYCFLFFMFKRDLSRKKQIGFLCIARKIPFFYRLLSYLYRSAGPFLVDRSKMFLSVIRWFKESFKMIVVNFCQLFSFQPSSPKFSRTFSIFFCIHKSYNFVYRYLLANIETNSASIVMNIYTFFHLKLQQIS